MMTAFKLTIKIALITGVFLTQIYSYAQTDTEIETTESQADLIGPFNRQQLTDTPTFNAWFSENYADYQLNDDAITQLKNLPKTGLSFKVIMGTWCSDSQREVPRFSKIMDTLQIDKSVIKFYALDADKLSPTKIEETYNISFVPTIIVYKDGKELNRIVEMSIRTLEEDLLLILTTNDYQHIYAE
ncbi:thioredoxin family protein [Bizionia sp. KMM 8389]